MSRENGAPWIDTDLNIEDKKETALKKRNKIKNEISDLDEEFKRKMKEVSESAHDENPINKRRSKLIKRKWEVNQRRLEKINTQVAIYLVISHARDLYQLSNRDTDNFDEIISDPEVDPAPIQESLREAVYEHDIDLQTVVEVQNQLDIHILEIDQRSLSGREAVPNHSNEDSPIELESDDDPNSELDLEIEDLDFENSPD